MRFLLLPLLLLPLTAPALAQMKFVLQYQDQFGKWHRYQEKHNEGDAYRTAKSRAAATGKRFRIVDGDGRLMDLVEPEGGSGGQSSRLVIQLAEGAGEKVLLDVLLENQSGRRCSPKITNVTEYSA